MSVSRDSSSSRRWHYHPELNERLPSYYDWPPKPLNTLRRLISAWSLFDVRIYVLGFAFLSWFYFSPSLQRAQTVAIDWIFEIWLRHFLVILFTAGALHLYFYTFNCQQDREKYDPRELGSDRANFLFHNQTFDNIFWVLTGTVAFLTVYEALMMWAYANQYAQILSYDENPFWFLLLIILVPGWTGFHFYWQHRLFHVPFFYRLGHHWHHKNINIGPWSGAAVHPLENLVWFSAVLILLLVPSHPIHAIFLMHLQVITAITTHVGYEHLMIGDKFKFRMGDFFHQLHHRFFDCNYGTLVAPWDRWFNTYHDGSSKSDERIQKSRRSVKSD